MTVEAGGGRSRTPPRASPGTSSGAPRGTGRTSRARTAPRAAPALARTQEGGLDAVFFALADPTRRQLLERLARCDATVGELAEPFDITMQAISRHLKVLERAGLVVRGQEAQWRTAGLDPRPLREVLAWVDPFRRFLDERPTGVLPDTGPDGPAGPELGPGGGGLGVLEDLG